VAVAQEKHVLALGIHCSSHWSNSKLVVANNMLPEEAHMMEEHQMDEECSVALKFISNN
jgi:hypothetical protein